MNQDKKQSIALMCYSAIAPLISGTQTDYESLSAFFREVSAKGLIAPNENYDIILPEPSKNGTTPIKKMVSMLSSLPVVPIAV